MLDGCVNWCWALLPVLHWTRALKEHTHALGMDVLHSRQHAVLLANPLWHGDDDNRLLCSMTA
jgi:hypothetical protein